VCYCLVVKDVCVLLSVGSSPCLCSGVVLFVHSDTVSGLLIMSTTVR
jgi:hypothetical protein